MTITPHNLRSTLEIDYLWPASRPDELNAGKFLIESPAECTCPDVVWCHIVSRSVWVTCNRAMSACCVLPVAVPKVADVQCANVCTGIKRGRQCVCVCVCQCEVEITRACLLSERRRRRRPRRCPVVESTLIRKRRDLDCVTRDNATMCATQRLIHKHSISLSTTLHLSFFRLQEAARLSEWRAAISMTDVFIYSGTAIRSETHLLLDIIPVDVGFCVCVTGER